MLLLFVVVQLPSCDRLQNDGRRSFVTHASSRLTSSWLPAGYAVQKIVEYIMYGGLSGKRDDRKAAKEF